MSLPISGFTAVPNPMMLSFLATQGFAIMYYGGAGWQFGKRKVSGMSNEQVNKMSPNDFLMQLHNETRTMVPTMAQGMKDMTPLVKTTLVLFGAYIREAIKAFPEVVQNILGSTDSGEFSNIPTSSGSSGNLPPQMASFLHYFATLSKATQGNIVAEAENPQLDTSGMSLAQHEENKRQKIIDADRAKVDRQNQLKRFGVLKTPIPQVRADVGKRPAGQSAKLERLLLIRSIDGTAKKLKELFRRVPAHSADRRLIESEIATEKSKLFKRQQKLVNLLARYRF